MLIYGGAGMLACLVSWISGKPVLIYAGLHALVWFLIGAISVGLGPWFGPIPLALALVISVLLFAFLHPIMRSIIHWLTYLDRMVYIEARPKQPSWEDSELASDPLGDEHGYHQKAPAKFKLFPERQMFPSSQPIDQAMQMEQKQ
jgi:hypothetical protein